MWTDTLSERFEGIPDSAFLVVAELLSFETKELDLFMSPFGAERRLEPVLDLLAVDDEYFGDFLECDKLSLAAGLDRCFLGLPDLICLF